jgi:N-methylhydantoinase B
LRCDAAGAGEFRGGPGVEYEVEITRPVQLSFRGEGTRRFPPRGAHGGHPGARGRLHCEPAEGPAFTPPAYGIRYTGPCRFAMSSQGGGGWGDALERKEEHVLADVRDGLVSEDAALRIYGVVLRDGGAAIDHAKTIEQRSVLRDRRSRVAGGQRPQEV